MNRPLGPYVTLDLETGTKTSFKRKGNPFDTDNKVVYAGWAVGKDGDPKMTRFGAAGMPDGWFADFLEEHWPILLVGINIKFDLEYLLRNDRDHDTYMRWVVAGGNLWDGQLGEYLLNGMSQEDHMLSMDELAPRYGGNTKFDEVKELWNAGVKTEDIDPALIERYLIGRKVWSHAQGEKPVQVWEHGDIGNTRLIFEGQLARARAAGQVKSILLNNGALLATVEMERNGMKVNVQRGREIARELEIQIAELVHELVGYLPDDLPFDFNWGSAAQKSALIFGGQVKYKQWAPHLDAQGNLQYAMKDELHYVGNDGNTYSVEQVEADGGPAKWNLATFTGGKNAGEYKTKKVKVPNLEKPKGAIQDFYYSFKGYTKPEKRWATSTPGQYSTGAEIIAELGNRDIPFLVALSKRTSLAKDLTTYYVTTDEKTGQEVGMLTLVQWDGIIHHMLNHTSTVTGRFSSSNPNLQNLPKGDKSEVKTIFISRFEDGLIIQSDFSSLEVYVQAILTRCRNLIEDLKQGLDMHCMRVSQKEGVTYEEAVKLCKGYVDEQGVKHDADPVWSKKRSKAKTFSFERAYGAGATSISTKNKIPLEEVEALIAAENERYPEVEQFYDTLTQIIGNQAQPTQVFVQHPDIPGLTCNLRRSYYRTPDNKLYMWREEPAPEWLAKMPASRGGRASSFSPTQIKNYPVQGTGGEWMKAAMWLLVREFYRVRNFERQALLVNTVHDAAYADAARKVALQAAQMIHACMLEASTFMEWYFGWNVPVPVPSDTSWGPSMGDEDSLPDGWLNDIPELRAAIRTRYMGGYTPSFDKENTNG